MIPSSSPLPSPSPTDSTTMSNPTTPAAKKVEDYEDYDVSPPKMWGKDGQTFDKAVRAINKDFNKLRVEWDKEEGKRTVQWFKKQDDGTEVELPLAIRRILLFLYGRNFKSHVGMDDRKALVKSIMKSRRSRKNILQVIKCTGDHSLSSVEKYQAHYIRACLTIHRYFQQTEATGFVPDMSSLTCYLRMQQFGSCFIQAPCVAMSYLLQAHGIDAPPPNASRLIRHHFDDEQLLKYISDNGGDSVGIFKILEEKFFDCQRISRDPYPVFSHELSVESVYNCATAFLKQGPALVSKFTVPQNFVCSPPSSDLKAKFPDLAPYENWTHVPANLIPPGAARFTTWNEPAEFIPLNAPSDEGLKKKEHVLKENWKTFLLQLAKGDGLSTAVTASMSADSSSSFADNGCLGTPSEESSNSNAPTFMFMDDDSDEEDWSRFFDDDQDDDDDEDDDSSSESYEDQHEPGEGADKTPLHAMVLLGHRIVDGSGYWLLQNSWEGPTQILEFSTEYLVESGAYLYFYTKNSRSPKNQWTIHESSDIFCPSPVAESSRIERSDCENWTDHLVHPGLRQRLTSDIDDDAFSID